MDGIEQSAGVYSAADGSTITITAQALPGHRLLGGTAWTHTFGSKPTCTRVAEQTPPDSGGAPAPSGNPPAPTAGHTPESIHPVITPVLSPVADTPHTSTPALAFTGSPTGWLLIIGSVLALAGAAMNISGLDRRWLGDT